MDSEPFRTICADPAWQFGDKLPGPSRGAEKNYRVMTTDDICHLQLPPFAPDCRLFLWRVASQVEEAYRVVRAWGFVPKAEIVWQKLTTNGLPWFGMGRQVRMSHEVCIVAIKGKPERLSASVRSTFSAPAGLHSEKPECFYRDIVEKLSPGPYVELFARRSREGWTCIGDEMNRPEQLSVTA